MGNTSAYIDTADRPRETIKNKKMKINIVIGNNHLIGAYYQHFVKVSSIKQ